MAFHYARDIDGIVTVTMDMQGQAANTMNAAWHGLIRDTVARLEAEPGLRGVILTSAKKTFFAGGDLNALLAMDGADEAFRANLALEKSYLRRLERLPVPVVAAINGAALGGGLEICLACHHRILLDDPAAVTGLPEVTLGLLPGAGGVVRLPRLVGLPAALDLLLSGRSLPPADALALGVVDALCRAGGDLLPAARAWILANPGGRQNREPDLDEAAMEKARRLLAQARAGVEARTRGKQPAPLRILEILEAGLGLDFDAALAFETRSFCALLGLPETKAAITLNFFAANAVRSGKLRPQAPRSRVLRLCPGPTPGRLERLAEARGITLAHDECDLAIDPADFAPLAAHGTAIATRLPVDTPDPARTAGLHLFAGTPGTRLAEIVATPGSTPEALARAYDFAQQIGLTPILVADTPGLFTPRVFAALFAECQHLLDEGLDRAQAERAAEAAGFARSPFAMAEALGLPLPAETPGRTDPADAQERLLAIPALEALRCLNEGVLRSEHEANLGSVLGLGFPVHTGGALQYMRGLGLEGFRARMEALAARHGPRFALTGAELAPLRDARRRAA